MYAGFIYQWIGEAYSLVACLSLLTIDHTSVSRPGTVPTPIGDTSNIWALITCFYYITYKHFWLLILYPLPVWPSVATMHLLLGIVFSLLSRSVSNFSMSRSSVFLFASKTRPVPAMWVLLFIALPLLIGHTCASCAARLLVYLQCVSISSFWQVQGWVWYNENLDREYVYI